MEGFLLRPAEGDEAGRCRKHPSAQPRTGGVCPECLRARLLRLCPECAGERPRGCSCPSTSSAAVAVAVSLSSLSASSSSSDVPSGSGSVGPVSHRVGGEPAFHRSRSAAPRPPGVRFDESAVGGDVADVAAPAQAHSGGAGWSWLWPFVRAKKAEKGKKKNTAATPAAAVPEASLPRSRSVGVVPGAYPPDEDRGIARCKGWSRYLAISTKSFRRTSRVVQARSPSAVTEENLELRA